MFKTKHPYKKMKAKDVKPNQVAILYHIDFSQGKVTAGYKLMDSRNKTDRGRFAYLDYSDVTGRLPWKNPSGRIYTLRDDIWVWVVQDQWIKAALKRAEPTP